MKIVKIDGFSKNKNSEECFLKCISEPMKRYINRYGWHFSKKMYDWAVRKMRTIDGRSILPLEKISLETIMNRNGYRCNCDNYDACYVYSMAYSDFLTSSLQDEEQLCRYVQDYLNDEDGYDSIAFVRFYADCAAKNITINWDEMI